MTTKDSPIAAIKAQAAHARGDAEVEAAAKEIARHEARRINEASDWADWHWEEFIGHAQGALLAAAKARKARRAG